jgi:beta-galactosidase/beta-glucuronidase
VEAEPRRLGLEGRWLVQLEPGGTFDPSPVPLPEGAVVASDVVRYRRSFVVPPAWRGDHVQLHFGAVAWQAVVHVDHELVGGHTGGDTPFHFDLGALRPGDHELVVDVFDPADRRDGARPVGIWRPVWLTSRPTAAPPPPRDSMR